MSTIWYQMNGNFLIIKEIFINVDDITDPKEQHLTLKNWKLCI